MILPVSWVLFMDVLLLDSYHYECFQLVTVMIYSMNLVPFFSIFFGSKSASPFVFPLLILTICSYERLKKAI